jgi:hypothetical protein
MMSHVPLTALIIGAEWFAASIKLGITGTEPTLNVVVINDLGGFLWNKQ